MSVFSQLRSRFSRQNTPTLTPTRNPGSLAGLGIKDLINEGTDAQIDTAVRRAKALFILGDLGFLFALHQYRFKAVNQSWPMPPALYHAGLLIPQEHWGGANNMGRWLYDTYIRQGTALEVNVGNEDYRHLSNIYNNRRGAFVPADFEGAEVDVLVTTHATLKLG